MIFIKMKVIRGIPYTRHAELVSASVESLNQAQGGGGNILTSEFASFLKIIKHTLPNDLQ